MLSQKEAATLETPGKRPELQCSQRSQLGLQPAWPSTLWHVHWVCCPPRDVQQTVATHLDWRSGPRPRLSSEGRPTNSRHALGLALGPSSAAWRKRTGTRALVRGTGKNGPAQRTSSKNMEWSWPSATRGKDVRPGQWCWDSEAGQTQKHMLMLRCSMVGWGGKDEPSSGQQATILSQECPPPANAKRAAGGGVHGGVARAGRCQHRGGGRGETGGTD